MNHVDLNLGVWYPMGGMGKVVERLYYICIENGVNSTSTRTWKASPQKKGP